MESATEAVHRDPLETRSYETRNRGSLLIGRLVGSAAAVLLAGVLAGCAEGQVPKFTTPIMWEGHESYSTGGTLEEHIVIELAGDGVAYLTNFPQGQSVRNEEGYFCVDDLKRERYSGAATWEARNGYSFFVRFGTSEILVSGETRPFGGQDWTELVFQACEPRQTWPLGYVCGNSGYGAGDERFSGFRVTCPPADEHG